MIFSEKSTYGCLRKTYVEHLICKNVIQILLTEGLEKNAPRPGIEPGPPG